MMVEKPKVGRYKKWQRRERDVLLSIAAVVLFIGQVAMCIVAYNFYGIGALLYPGWILMVAAIIVGVLSWYAAKRQSRTEDREWLENTVLVDTGIYEVIRHPVYFCFMLFVVSLMFISHWVTIILGVPIVWYLYELMKVEEWINIDKFGEEYTDYTDRVPRMNFVSGLIRFYRKRKDQL